MLVVIAGSVFIVALGLAVLYDWRSRRRSWTVRGPREAAYRPAPCQGRYREPDRTWQDRRP
jgi:hypothetical protein